MGSEMGKKKVPIITFIVIGDEDRTKILVY